MLIDSHVHFSHQRFDGTFRYLTCGKDGAFQLQEVHRLVLLQEMRETGIVGVIEPGITLASNYAAAALARQYASYVFPAVGVHPTRVADERWGDRKKLIRLSEEPGVVAIGETGLDYHRARNTQHRLWQKAWFIFQLKLAHQLQLPLVLHIRQADRAALQILRLYRNDLHGGVVHCFSGDYKTAKVYAELGFSLGIGGTLLQKNDGGAGTP